MNITVTIARQLGCGGSEIGRRIASALGVSCIDREIISRTAERFDLSEREVAAREERVSSFWERMLNGFAIGAPEAAYLAPPFQTPTDQEIFEDETEVLRTTAQQESCVIVGRAAAHILEPHPGMVNLLLHAPLKFRVPRVMEYYGAGDEEQARALIAQSDAMRGKFMAQMAKKSWTAAENYHLAVDSSTLPLPELAEFLTAYIRRKVAVAREQTATEPASEAPGT